MTRDAPLPPEWIARRGVILDAGDPMGSYVRDGLEMRSGIDSLLGPEWSWEGKRVLDFGCSSGRVLRHFLEEASTVAEFHGCDVDGPSIDWLRENLSPPLHVVRNDADPPLPYEAQSFDVIYAWSVFTHLYWNWSTWLLEMHRLLVDDGILIASILGPGMSMEIAGEPWDEDRIGINVLGRGEEDWSATYVLHSEWWLRAHWGRAFEFLVLFSGEPGSGQGVVMMRRRDVSLTRADLEALEPDEPREVLALQHNVRQLFRESPALGDRYKRDYEEIKRAYDEVVTSRSWRLTSPLRGIAARARGLRRTAG
jgi:SAM-dependent methyltransferase